MWADIELVSLDQVKQHLKLPATDAEDEDLTLKLVQAHALVLDYVDRPSDTDWHAEILAWTDETAPPAIQAAILRQVGDLYRFRGDDDDDKADGLNLSPRVKQLLLMYRTPSLA